MQVFFTAIIESAGDGFSVYFPDIPGCTSAGTTVQEAALAASEALDFHVQGMILDGAMLPAPTPIEKIERDEEGSEIVRMLVPVETPGRSKRLNITMDEALVAAIDRATSNRSGFLAAAAREKLRAA